MRCFAPVLPLLTAVVLFAAAASARTTAPTAPRVRVFIDCQNVYCDQEYFRTEIAFVDHVRDRRDADVHILITSEPSGGGGREYTLRFIGLQRFASQDDTLRHSAIVSASEDTVRSGLVRTMKVGLVRYALHSPVADRLRVTEEAVPRGTTASAKDRWNYWTFRARVNGYFSGEQSSKSKQVYSSVTANRITEAWKITVSLNNNYNDNSFVLPDAPTFLSVQRGYAANALVVKSVGKQWAVGAWTSISSSTRVNQDLAVTIAPAIEYDFFPYSESTKRLFVVNYAIGLKSFRYAEVTLFDTLSETHASQSINVGLSLRQPWGSVSSTVEWVSFLPDVKKNHTLLFGEVDLKLVKGLSLNVFGDVSSIRDQLYLPKRDATAEEILVRQRQLATNYRYFFGAGISYTFGSIFSAIVNPRFRSLGDF